MAGLILQVFLASRPTFLFPEEKGTQVTPSTSHSRKLARVFFLTRLIRHTATPCHSTSLGLSFLIRKMRSLNPDILQISEWSHSVAWDLGD